MSEPGTTLDSPPIPPAEPSEAIRIRGARVHNLKNVDVDIPRDRLVVITGVSGSGKSSLAFDTLFAEGQRQYIESLSVHARQFFDQMERPDVDLIDGLQPTLSIEQRAGNPNPRSTVATVTEIYDYLRLLMARVGIAHCPQCGLPISQQSPEQILSQMLQLPEGTKAMLLAPMIRGKRGKHPEAFVAIRKAGFVRARIDGSVYDIDALPEIEPRKTHTIEAVVDRIVVRDKFAARMAESIDLAIVHGQGALILTVQEKTEGVIHWNDELFSTQYACPDCHVSFEELEPRTFSFNSPYGACEACSGLGVNVRFDPELVLGDSSQSLSGGVIVPWIGSTAKAAKKRQAELADFMAASGFDWETPLDQLAPKTLDQLLHGDHKNFHGIFVMLEKEYATATREEMLERLETFRGKVVCRDCQGARLRPEARSVLVGGRPIQQITALDVRSAQTFFDALEFDEKQSLIARPILQEIVRRLAFLDKVGVDYLTLDRSADTLSGGEHQRVRLATNIGSGLVGTCYVLDEPSIGLHQRDNDRLIEALRDLQNQDNTVIVVEHDEAMMWAADHLIDVGPTAGRGGGQIVAQGTPAEVAEHADSLTGRYLSGKLRIEIPQQRRRAAKSRAITLEGATANNLQDVSAWFPLGLFTCITGVSGSGKSSLMNETLARAILRRLGGLGPRPGNHTSLRGVSQIDKLIDIDQSPIGRTPRSNPATYTGVFDEIRKVFAGTKESKRRGYRVGRFSFNNKGGRCDDCQGQGQQKIEMNFLPDLHVPCATCGGDRFNRQTLEVRYRDHSIADVLAMSVDEAAELFENFPMISRVLGCLRDVGLGYVTLGQPSTTLSGGEAQRIKLATELARVETGNTLYLLDEPTTGLHFDDIRRLLDVLSKLVDRGNTVIVIEHNLDVIKSADWIIDLGPDGGKAGGQIIATGTPEQVAETAASVTGQYLQEVLQAP